ncbi:MULTISPECIES: hypothetical protein [Streptomyces]|uniref:Uncharacterized protein n=2 Tax=Streptomyces TaxID=1883 RepID=A0A2N8P8U7_STRNR|nr:MULTISPECIES: hypothetical protein [Streptomyces]PNE37447.1 hypothetical protein AOB60_24375 [Streptomyces noursei]SHM19740.1 hypothetical protein SAMN05216268_10986 [Streptomyces yunnanensis]
MLLVLTGAAAARLKRCIADLRSLANADPDLPTAGIRAGVTTLDQLREQGRFACIFTPILGPATPTDIWLSPNSNTASAA